MYKKEVRTVLEKVAKGTTFNEILDEAVDSLENLESSCVDRYPILTIDGVVEQMYEEQKTVFTLNTVFFDLPVVVSNILIGKSLRDKGSVRDLEESGMITIEDFEKNGYNKGAVDKICDNYTIDMSVREELITTGKKLQLHIYEEFNQPRNVLEFVGEMVEDITLYVNLIENPMQKVRECRNIEVKQELFIYLLIYYMFLELFKKGSEYADTI